MEIVKLLIGKEADINSKNDFGQTALVYAAEGGPLEVVKFLVEKGLNVTARDRFGRRLSCALRKKGEIWM